MPGTYEPIATSTLGSSTTTVTFSSIPSTYTDLVLVLSMQSTSADDIDTRYWLRFNSDSGSNYSMTTVEGDTVNPTSGRNVSRTQFDNLTNLSSSPEFTLATFNIMNYSNTTTYKTLLNRAGQQSNNVGTSGGTRSLYGALVGLWRDTSAINRIDIICAVNGQFATGSMFTIYGIKAA
jgi:hypothetical protein